MVGGGHISNGCWRLVIGRHAICQHAFTASKPVVQLHDGTGSMNVQATDSDNVTLVCSATGIPVASIHYWYNKPTQTTEIAAIKTNSTIVSEVVLHNVRQSVTVNCVATNRLGFDEQSLNINVLQSGSKVDALQS